MAELKTSPRTAGGKTRLIDRAYNLEVAVKQFMCGDVVPGCSAVLRGTENEILTAVAAHADADDPTAVTDSLLAQVRERIVIAA